MNHTPCQTWKRLLLSAAAHSLVTEVKVLLCTSKNKSSVVDSIFLVKMDGQDWVSNTRLAKNISYTDKTNMVSLKSIIKSI